MKLDVLLSCMHQTDDALIRRSHITGNAVVINQGDREGERCVPTARGSVRWIDSLSRGLTVSRNLAIEGSDADICMLCDDDEVFADDYEQRILGAYETYPQADLIMFNIENWRNPFGNEPRELKFPTTIRASSVQISFRRESLIRTGVRFDLLLGAGSGNGAEEEMKFLLDCHRAGLRVFYVPVEVARLNENESTWFSGFDETFFYNRGATTRYILGLPLAVAYGLYYVIRKRDLYADQISTAKALKAIFRGIAQNKITKQAEGK